MYEGINTSPQPRRDIHRLQEWRHDPYLVRHKWREPCHCPDCSLVYRHGFWQRADVAAHSTAHPCPACLRIRDRCPAAFLTLSGDYFEQHRHPILRQVGRLEVEERLRYPLGRIMLEEDIGEEHVIQYTDPHLARLTGYALHAAHRGQVRLLYQNDEYLVRVYWVR